MKKYYFNGRQVVKADIVRKSMKKYLEGGGKEVRQAYLKKNKKQISEYNKEYQRKLRQFRKENWLCAVCGQKRTEQEVRLVCNACKKRAVLHLRNHRKNKRLGGN